MRKSYYLVWIDLNEYKYCAFLCLFLTVSTIFYCAGDAKSHGLLDLGGGGMGPPFLDLCQSIEERASKRSEKIKPLPCPNFPKLPPKRRHKSSNNVIIQDTRNLISSKNQGTYVNSWLENFLTLKCVESTLPV